MEQKQSIIAHIPLPPEEDLAKTPPSVLAWIKAVICAFEERICVLEEQNKKLEEQNKKLEARILELESLLDNNSSNSNKPPSSDSPFKKPSPKVNKKKRKKRAGVRQQMLEPTKTENCMPSVCRCGCRKFTDVKEYYRHQHIEIPEPALEVTHFVLHKGRCANCKATIKAYIPHEFRFGFGVRVHALITECCGMHGASRESVQTFLKSMYGLSISQGAIQKCLDRASKAIFPHYKAIEKAAHETQVNYVDETTWRRFGHEGAALRWLWVMASSNIAYFKLARKRNKEAFEVLVGDWDGVLVSDGYGVYQKWGGKARQTCLAHLIRAAQKLKESKKAQIALCGTWIKDELVRLCRMKRHLPTFGEVSALHMRLHGFVQKYKYRKDAAGTFARRIEREMPHMKVFREYEDVDPTNNHAERSLRFAVTWRKRSCGTTSEKGDRFVERVLSLRHTCRLQGRSTFATLVEVLANFAKGVLVDMPWVAGEKLTP